MHRIVHIEASLSWSYDDVPQLFASAFWICHASKRFVLALFLMTRVHSPPVSFRWDEILIIP